MNTAYLIILYFHKSFIEVVILLQFEEKSLLKLAV